MEQWLQIRQRVLRQGVSKRQILRETGMHWTTLEKILQYSRPPGYRRGKPPRKPKIGPYPDRIRQILDELGYVPFSKTGAELLFEVVSRAYERLSLVVTTNLPFESWTEVLGCERLTGALLDRLTHRVHIIEANGPSYRLRESKRRLERPRSKPQESEQTEPKQS